MLAFLLQRWVLGLLLVLVLSVLVWFAGPLVAIADAKPWATPVARLITMFVLLLVWALTNLRLRVRESKASATLAQQLERNVDERPVVSGKADVTPDDSVLAERLKEALRTLHGAKLGKGKKLYRLPWYVIIGAPGSGKTTALKQSGLHFPLRSQLGDEPVKGAGGTRYCDWWFTDEAVLIDTAGRYTTQDNPQKIESRAWLRFLALLRKSRPKRPLNGILVAVSVLDLLQKTPTQQALHTAAVKRRILELNQALGMHLPVYVLITKLDRVAGFSAFFSDLEPEQRNQVWGLKFSLDEKRKTKDPLTQFERDYPALIRRLDDRVLTRLHQERDPHARALVYEFPKQMLSLEPKLQGFLTDIFSRNQFETGACLRGLFFISGTQDSATAQWVTGVLPTDHLLQPASLREPDPKSFFINGLLRNFVFKEANLASANERTQRRYRLVYASLAAGTLALFAGLLALWQTSETRNQQYLDRVVADVQRYNDATGANAEGQLRWDVIANKLNVIRNLPTGYQRPEAPQDWMGLGLYQGEKIGAQASQTYTKLLERILLPAVANQLLVQIQSTLDNPEALYESLKFYLMLYHPDHMDADGLAIWMDLLWQQHLPGDGNAAYRKALATHLRTAIAEKLPPPRLDEHRVEQARAALLETPLDQRAYMSLINGLLRENKPPFTVERAIGRQAPALFQRRSDADLNQGIPWAFTYEGFHTGFNVRVQRLPSMLKQEHWIYGDALAPLDDAQLDALVEGVSQRYFDEYIDRWRTLLSDLTIPSFRDANRGALVVRTLAGADQPLLKFLDEVRHHTALSELPAPSKNQAAAAEIAKEAASSSRLSSYIPSGNMPEVQLPGHPVTSAFTDFNDFVAQTGDGTPKQQLQHAFAALNQYFERLTARNDFQRAAYEASARSTEGGDPLTVVHRALSGSPVLVRQWFQSVTADSSRISANATKGHLNAVWNAEVMDYFERAIAGRYPVDPASRVDIKLADFKAFFGPGGILDQYFTTHIKPFADTDQTPWRWRKRVGMSNKTLRMFERAKRIQRAYFGAGQGELKVGFDLLPQTLDRAAARILVQVGTQPVQYEHGPLRNVALHWPTPDNDAAKVVFTLASQGTPISVREQGEWSWFRLLDRHADRRAADEPDNLVVTFHVQGLEARFHLSPHSAFNPFTANDLQNFTLPERL